MAELMEAIKNRRSIRVYEEKEIPEDVFNQVLEAVRWSPSWANTQCWEIVAVKDPAVKQKLQETLVKTNPARKAIVEAPVVLALAGKLKSSGYYKGESSTSLGDWYMFDLGLAAQTLCLAAQDLGLGTVMVGLYDVDKAAEVIGVPADHQLVTLIPMGYVAKDSKAPKRREVSEFTHENRF